MNLNVVTYFHQQGVRQEKPEGGAAVLLKHFTETSNIVTVDPDRSAFIKIAPDPRTSRTGSVRWEFYGGPEGSLRVFCFQAEELFPTKVPKTNFTVPGKVGLDLDLWTEPRRIRIVCSPPLDYPWISLDRRGNVLETVPLSGPVRFSLQLKLNR